MFKELKIKHLILISFFVLLLIVLFGCTETNDSGLREQLDGNVSLLNQANTRIVELQESARYSSEELKKARQERNDLQEVYNSLNTDFQACYFANYCLYYPLSCEEYFDDGVSASDKHLIYADYCDSAYRDWDKYVGYDSDLIPEIQ